MKNNKPAKKAAPKTAKKVEKKAVAAKKVAPSKRRSQFLRNRILKLRK